MSNLCNKFNKQTAALSLRSPGARCAHLPKERRNTAMADAFVTWRAADIRDGAVARGPEGGRRPGP